MLCSLITVRTAEVRHSTKVLVGRSGEGLLADYTIRERDEEGVTRHAELRGYPRWSEPASGLMARAMDALWPQSVGTSSEDLAAATVRGECSLVTRHAQRLLYGWQLQLVGSSGFLDVWDEASRHDIRHVAIQGARDWRSLVLQGQCFATWGRQHLAPWPAPVDIPVHEYKELRYVRLSDMPELARCEFARRRTRSPRPTIPDVDDAFYAWDWQDFMLGYR